MREWSIIQGSHLRKVVGHGSLYFIASVVTKALNAFLLPVYTHWLRPEEYAVYSNLFAIAALVGVFTSLYMDNAYARFFFDTENNPREMRQIFSTIFLFMLGWSLVAVTVLFFIIRGPIVRTYEVSVVPYVLLVCAIPLMRQFNILAAVHFRSQHKSVHVTGVKFLWCAASTTVSLVLLLGVGLKAQALLWGVLAGESASLLLYYTWLFRAKLVGGVFSLRFLKDALVYSLGLLPLTASSWLSGYSDRLLIAWFGDMVNSGVYSVAFEVGRLANMAVLPIFMVYGPMIFAMLKENREKNIPRIEAFQSFYFHLLLGCAFLLSLFTPEIFHFAVDERYYTATIWVPVIAFAFVFGGVRKLYATLIYYHKMTLLISLGGIMQALINFGLNILLIPKFGGSAAAWSKFVSMVIIAVYFYLLSRKYEPLRINWGALRTTLSILAVCLGAFGLCVYVLRLTFWPLLVAKVAIALLAIVLTWFSCFGDELRRMLFGRKGKEPSRRERSKEAYDSISEIEEV